MFRDNVHNYICAICFSFRILFVTCYTCSLSLTLKVLSGTLSDLGLKVGCFHASIFIHKSLLSTIMRAPLTFFETTPTGRILSRFSNDLEIIDDELEENLLAILWCFYEVNFCLFRQFVFMFRGPSEYLIINMILIIYELTLLINQTNSLCKIVKVNETIPLSGL